MSLRKPDARPLLSFQLLQVSITLAQHPNCERELVVWVRERDRPVEHPFDRFLCPRTVLQRGKR